MIWARLWAYLSVRLDPWSATLLAMHLVGEGSFGLGFCLILGFFAGCAYYDSNEQDFVF